MMKRVLYAVGAVILTTSAFAQVAVKPQLPSRAQEGPQTRAEAKPKVVKLEKWLEGFAALTGQPAITGAVQDKSRGILVPGVGHDREVHAVLLKGRRRRPQPPANRGVYVVCDSRDYGYKSCGVGMRINQVILRDQQSKTPCIYGQNWGWDMYNVWVDQGCRAGFDVFGYPY